MMVMVRRRMVIVKSKKKIVEKNKKEKKKLTNVNDIKILTLGVHYETSPAVHFISYHNAAWTL